MPREITERLAGLIRELIEPQSWEADGAALEPLRGALLVRNTAYVQRRVGQLLNAVRLFSYERTASDEEEPPQAVLDELEDQGLFPTFTSCWHRVVYRFPLTRPVWKRQRAGHYVALVVYALNRPSEDGEPTLPSGEEMQRVIRKYVEPESWQGEQPLGFVRPLPGVLVVEHTAEVHKQVAALLRGAGVLSWYQFED